MCWYSEKLKIKTAKRDIPVWKVVKTVSYDPTHCLAYYRNHSYSKDTLEVGYMEFKVDGGFVKGSMGFHSYFKKLKLYKTENYIYVAITNFFGFIIKNI